MATQGATTIAYALFSFRFVIVSRCMGFRIEAPTAAAIPERTRAFGN